MAFELNQLCIDTDHRNNPIFAEYRFASIAHDDLGGWLLAIDDGRYVICETDDAVNIYGRNRDDLMARHDRGEWSDPAHGEGAPVSRAAQSEARIKELEAALSSAQAACEMALETLIGCCVSAGGVDDRKTINETKMALRKVLGDVRQEPAPPGSIAARMQDRSEAEGKAAP